MTKSPKPDEMSPLVEALAQVKYDEKLNSKKDLAISYKDDGNNNFKLKKYNWAIDCYSKGLLISCNDPDIEANLYNNRSSAHFFLGNYRSSLKDGLKALELIPTYEKAAVRVAKCYFLLNRFDECVNFCEKSTFREQLTEWHKKSVSERKKVERDRRKAEHLDRKIKEKADNLIKAMLERKIFISDRSKIFKSLCSDDCDFFPYLNDDSEILWPVRILYSSPVSVPDLIKEFNENDMLLPHLKYLLPGDETHPPWDKKREYYYENVQIAFMINDDYTFINPKMTLREVIGHKNYALKELVVTLVIFTDEDATLLH